MKDIETIKEQAKKGDIQSQVELAHAYLNGEGTIKNRALYLKWLEQAGRQGHLDSQLELIAFYTQKKNKYSDPVKALFWIREAQKLGATFTDEQLLEAGEPEICGRLIEKYLFGEGKEHNFEKAKDLILRVKPSQETLLDYAKRYYDIYHDNTKMLSNICYFLKLSFNQNHQKLNEYAVELTKNKAKNNMKIAFSLFSEAYRLGNPYAASSYLYCLLNGKGCKRDINKGISTYFECKQKNIDVSRAFASAMNKGRVAKLPNSLYWKISCLIHKAEDSMAGMMKATDNGLGILLEILLFLLTPIRVVGVWSVIISLFIFVCILRWENSWCILIRHFFESLTSYTLVGYIILFVLLMVVVSVCSITYRSVTLRNYLKKYGLHLPPFFIVNTKVTESTIGCFGPSSSTTVYKVLFFERVNYTDCSQETNWTNPNYPLETMEVRIVYLTQNKAEIILGYWYEP